MSGDDILGLELDSRMMYTDDDGKSYDIEGMIDALDHIMRVSRQANTITTRLKMIELRAKSALEGTDEWKDYDYPRNRAGQRENLRRRYRDLRDLFVKLYDAQGDKFEDTAEQALEKAGL